MLNNMSNESMHTIGAPSVIHDALEDGPKLIKPSRVNVRVLLRKPLFAHQEPLVHGRIIGMRTRNLVQTLTVARRACKHLRPRFFALSCREMSRAFAVAFAVLALAASASACTQVIEDCTSKDAIASGVSMYTEPAWETLSPGDTYTSYLSFTLSKEARAVPGPDLIVS